MHPEALQSRRRAAGQAMVETVIVFPLLALLLFGTLQVALLYHAKIQLNYAAFEAARAGSMNNAEAWAMEAGLVRGLVPLHTHDDGRGWLRWGRGKVWKELAEGRLRIDLVNPSPDSFEDHGIDADRGGTPVRMIPNDHLMYRDARVKSVSSQSIQDANLLKIRVLYCYEMKVPFANRVINGLLRTGATAAPGQATLGAGQMARMQTSTATGFAAPSGSFEAQCLNLWQTGGTDAWRRHMPIVAQALVRMQSPAIQTSP